MPRLAHVLASVLPLASGAAGTCKIQVDPAKLEGEMKTDGLMSHLEALQEIATANGGNRAFGETGYAASVDYVYGLVSALPGTRAWTQDFPAWYGGVRSVELRVGGAEGEETYVYGLTYSPSTPAEGVTAALVAAPAGVAGCDAANYAGLDVAGKIVLVERFRCPTGGTLAGRVVPAAAAGAAAVLVYSDGPTKPTAGSLGTPDPERHVPAGFITRDDGLALLARLEAGEDVSVYFQQTQVVEERITQNVFVETEGGDPDNVIVLGAHLDSVQAGPGINDDGSGTALLLELSKAFVRYKAKNKVRFAWWGAEENGLLGSRYYCSNLDTAEVDQVLAYLNFDMVSKGYIGVADTDGSTHGVAGPPGSDAIEHLFEDYYAARDVEITSVLITNGSDYASWWQILNKPFGYLHTGTGVAQDPCYHQVCDTIENPDPETLTINAKAAAYVLAELAVNGTELIPKVPTNASMFENIRARSVDADFVAIAELEALGERHLGCGHDI